jgi:hypothetical protein
LLVSGKARDRDDYYVLVSELFASREAGMEPDAAFMQDLVRRYENAKPFLPPEIQS